MVREQLQWQDVDDSLETIYSGRKTDSAITVLDVVITLSRRRKISKDLKWRMKESLRSNTYGIANDDWVSLACSHLFKGALDLGVQ